MIRKTDVFLCRAAHVVGTELVCIPMNNRQKSVREKGTDRQDTMEESLEFGIRKSEWLGMREF